MRIAWTHHRGASFGSLMAVIIVAFGTASAATNDHCKVQLGRGWSSLTGRGAITMRNVGKPCGDILYSVPETRIPVDSITVEVAPQKGAVRIQVPRFFYTPQAEFVGRDRFTLVAEGPNPVGQMRVRLKGRSSYRWILSRFHLYSERRFATTPRQWRVA